jgi:hypothetical protein
VAAHPRVAEPEAGSELAIYRDYLRARRAGGLVAASTADLRGVLGHRALRVLSDDDTRLAEARVVLEAAARDGAVAAQQSAEYRSQIAASALQRILLGKASVYGSIVSIRKDIVKGQYSHFAVEKWENALLKVIARRAFVALEDRAMSPEERGPDSLHLRASLMRLAELVSEYKVWLGSAVRCASGSLSERWFVAENIAAGTALIALLRLRDAYSSICRDGTAWPARSNDMTRAIEPLIEPVRVLPSRYGLPMLKAVEDHSATDEMLDIADVQDDEAVELWQRWLRSCDEWCNEWHGRGVYGVDPPPSSNHLCTVHAHVEQLDALTTFLRSQLNNL